MFVAPNQSWAQSISFSNPRDEWLHVVELFNYSDKLTNPPNIGFDLWPKEEEEEKKTKIIQSLPNPNFNFMWDSA